MAESAPERKNEIQTGTGRVAAAMRKDHEPESGIGSCARKVTNAGCAREHAPIRNKVSRCCMPLLPALLLGYAVAANAALGGLPEQFGTDGVAVVSSVSTQMPNYSVRATTLATGTQVREYISGAGKVFALAWNGPVLPDLKALLGQYYDAMAAELARLPRVGRSYIAVNSPEVVIYSGGHRRAFEGSAWIPAQLPAGFIADDVR